MSRSTTKSSIINRPRGDVIQRSAPAQIPQQYVKVSTTSDALVFAYGYKKEDVLPIDNIIWLNPSTPNFSSIVDEIVTGLRINASATLTLLASIDNADKFPSIVRKLPQYLDFESRYTLGTIQQHKKLEGKEMDEVCGFNGCTSTKFYCWTAQTRSRDEGLTFFTKCMKCKNQRSVGA